MKPKVYYYHGLPKYERPGRAPMLRYALYLSLPVLALLGYFIAKAVTG